MATTLVSLLAAAVSTHLIQLQLQLHSGLTTPVKEVVLSAVPTDDILVDANGVLPTS
jgi:hypothetical protein